MNTFRLKTFYLFILLYLFFGWINYSNAQDKNPFSSLIGKQLLSLPGKSIHDPLIESLLNTKHLHYRKGTQMHFNQDGKMDTLYDWIIFNEDVKYGYGYIIKMDTLQKIILHNGYIDCNNQKWNRYKDKLSLKLNWKMSMKDIVKILGKPNEYGDVLDEFDYPDKRLHFSFDGIDFRKSKIQSIEIGR